MKNINSLRQQLCEAGRSLIKKELVARTWGNFSVRIDDHTFLITPSGRSYENLLPKEIVTVNLTDLSYQGILKPSSEKELHALIYRHDKNIRSIVHTHQFWASAVAAAHHSITVTEGADRERFGEEIPCAPYALPTTSALAKSVLKTLVKRPCPGVLLANHGAVCMGSTIAAAVSVAENLEKAAQTFILTEFQKLSGNPSGKESEMIAYYLRHRKGAGA